MAESLNAQLKNERTHFTHTFFALNVGMVCLSLSERLKLKHLGQKLQEKTSSLFFQPGTSPPSVYTDVIHVIKLDQAFPPPFLQTASDQKLDSGKAWERAYHCTIC